MYKSLSIHKSILDQMAAVFSNSVHEAGYLLGCSTRLDCLDHCEQLPPVQAGLHFYEPDSAYANSIINQWASQNICFCGMIHSHVVEKETLSEADVVFAKQLFHAYSLPVLWFGLALVDRKKVNYQFYGITDHSMYRINMKEIPK